VAGVVGRARGQILDVGGAVEAVGMTAGPFRRPGVNDALTPKPRRREVETSTWVQMFPRLLRAWVRRAQAEGDLDALAALAQHRGEVDAHLVDMVAVLRAEPWSYSWQQIADALGCSRQAAQQRWHKAGGHRQVGGQPGDLR
jgi:hypothetical protein